MLLFDVDPLLLYGFDLLVFEFEFQLLFDCVLLFEFVLRLLYVGVETEEEEFQLPVFTGPLLFELRLLNELLVLA